MTVYGVLPVGGKGSRLGLPFPKELLPQKGFTHYNPLINHVVEKMKQAGAETICFVHGNELKKGIVGHYSDQVHLVQRTPGFATVLRDFYEFQPLKDDDQILFGLPDSIFEGNPFIEMVEQNGIVCGLFNSDPYTKVDRLQKTNDQFFEVKTQKTDSNQNWFWGIIKFDGADLNGIIEAGLLDRYTEIGDILNQCDKTHVYGESYLDLGTWENYNRYLRLFNGETVC